VREHWAKSTYCSTNACIEVGWQKPATDCADTSHCNCTIYIRDSKNPHQPPHTFTHTEWVAFTNGIKAGEFD
jgi:hypothetical protein